MVSGKEEDSVGNGQILGRKEQECIRPVLLGKQQAALLKPQQN